MQCHCVKMEFQKIVNLLDTTSDDKNLPRFVTKKWIEGYDKTERNYNVNKEIRIKTPMLRSDLWDYSDAYIVVKVNITVTAPDNAKRNKSVAFKNNAPFINCISKINGVQIDLNTVKITEKKYKVCVIITATNQVILFLLILNLLNTRQALQEILTIFLMVMMIMMQPKLVKMKLKLLYH